MPMVMMGNLVRLLGQSVSQNPLDMDHVMSQTKDGNKDMDVLQDTEESVDDALNFIDGF